MDPQLEFFLEEAFKSVQPTSPEIGRAVVEPDYDVSPIKGDGPLLADELVECIRHQLTDSKKLSSREGQEINVPKGSILGKYVRKIILHEDTADGPWVEVAPPGNWI